MTQEEKDLFIEIAQLGICCGLSEPLEWFKNYIHVLPNMVEYSQLQNKEKEAIKTFLAFFNGSGIFNPEITEVEFSIMLQKYSLQK